MRLRSSLVASGFVLLAAGSASGVGILDNLLTISNDAGSWTYSGADLGCQITGGTDDPGEGPASFSCDGGGVTIAAPGGLDWEISDWNIYGEFDPFVSSNFSFKNLSAVPVPFTIIVSLPVLPLGPTTVMGGSTGGSVTDANFDGLGGLSTVAPTAFFTGMIDGLPVGPAAELHPDPFSVGFLFAGDTQNIPAVNFGLPGPTVPGPAVAASIGIQNKFTLSGGDSIASTNFFVVEVPEASTILLIATGLAGLAWRVRREPSG